MCIEIVTAFLYQTPFEWGVWRHIFPCIVLCSIGNQTAESHVLCSTPADKTCN